jgi:ABC-2 type transport system permease protein
VAAALPASVQHPVEEFWPTQAGAQVTEVVRQAHTLSPWAGFGLMLLFVAIALSAAFSLLNRRDA